MSIKRAAGFVIFQRQESMIKYLLLQTSYGEHHWTPPKGHVDPGESDMETALRETVEESGLTRQDLKVYENGRKEINYKVKGKPKIVIYWLAELVNPKAKVELSEEHQDFKWLELEEACRYGSYTEMQETLKYFDKFIQTNLK